MDTRKFILYLVALLIVSFFTFFFWNECEGTPRYTDQVITVKGADGTEYNSVEAACGNGDFNAAREYIAQMKEALKKDGLSSDSKYAESIHEQEEYMENEEIQYLASMNDEQANNKIVLILNQKYVEGNQLKEMECLEEKHIMWQGDFARYPYKDSPEPIRNFGKYINWCKDFHNKCNTVLTSAIACGNQDLAEKTLRCYRPDPEFLFKNKKELSGNDVICDVYAHYTNASKDAAQKKYDEAVKSGVFK